MTPVIEQVPFHAETQMVATHIGAVPFTDLRYEMLESRAKDVLVVAREWFYTGNDPEKQALAGANYIKRDVWVTILIGKPINAEQGTLGG